MSDITESVQNNEIYVEKGTSKTKNNPQQQEVKDLIEILHIEQQKYRKYKAIYDTVQDLTKDSSNELDDELKSKIKSIMLSAGLSQTCILEDNLLDKNCSTLLTQCSEPDLTYTESNKLKTAVEKELHNKVLRITHEFKKLTNKDIKILSNKKETPLLQFSADDKVLLEYKNKLTTEQEIYVKNLLLQQELLDEIANLRLKKLPKVVDQKKTECALQTKMNYLKSKISQEKIRVDIFTETSKSLEAYKEIIKSIKSQQEECQKEITHLQEMKEQYSQVSCRQFDEILKSYLQYKASLEKKKLLYESIKN